MRKKIDIESLMCICCEAIIRMNEDAKPEETQHGVYFMQELIERVKASNDELDAEEKKALRKKPSAVMVEVSAE